MGGKGIQLQVEKMRESAVARARCGEKSGLEWRGLNLVPKVFGLCAAPCGTKADEPTQTRKDGHERVWKVVTTNPHTRGGKVVLTEARGDGKLKEQT